MWHSGKDLGSDTEGLGLTSALPLHSYLGLGSYLTSLSFTFFPYCKVQQLEQIGAPQFF